MSPVTTGVGGPAHVPAARGASGSATGRDTGFAGVLDSALTGGQAPAGRAEPGTARRPEPGGGTRSPEAADRDPAVRPDEGAGRTEAHAGHRRGRAAAGSPAGDPDAPVDDAPDTDDGTAPAADATAPAVTTAGAWALLAAVGLNPAPAPPGTPDGAGVDGVATAAPAAAPPVGSTGAATPWTAPLPTAAAEPPATPVATPPAGLPAAPSAPTPPAAATAAVTAPPATAPVTGALPTGPTTTAPTAGTDPAAAPSAPVPGAPSLVVVPAAAPDGSGTSPDGGSGSSPDGGTGTGAARPDAPTAPADPAAVLAAAPPLAAPGPAAPPVPPPAVPVPVATQLGPHLAVLRSAPDGTHTMTVVLTPETLGPVAVQVTVTDGQLDLVLHGAHAHGRHALTEALPELRRDLEASGLSFSRLEIGSDAGASTSGGRSGQFAGFDAQGGAGQPQQRPGAPARGWPTAGPVAAAGTAPAAAGSPSPGLDIRV